MTIAANVSAAAARLTSSANHRTEPKPRATANTLAARTETMPVTRGRCFVRFMSRSMSRSKIMLNVLAEPAAAAPPMRVATTSHRPGQPPAARNIVGIVVTRSSSMMRGFVSATYALILSPALVRPAAGPGLERRLPRSEACDPTCCTYRSTTGVPHSRLTGPTPAPPGRPRAPSYVPRGTGQSSRRVTHATVGERAYGGTDRRPLPENDRAWGEAAH